MSERRIIRGAKILPMDGRRQPKRGDMLISGGVISAIGGIQDMAGALIAQTSSVLLPGFVQAHVHLDQALLDRDFVPNADPFWFCDVQVAGWLSRSDGGALKTQAAAAFCRGMTAGATTFADAGRDGGRSFAIEAALALGTRLIAPLDASSRDVTGDLEGLRQWLDQNDPQRRIALAISAGDAERVSSARLRAAARLAAARSLPLIVHAASLPGDSGGVSRLDRAGALGKNLVLCHGRGPSLGRSAKVLAQAGASVVVTPGSDLLFHAPPPAYEQLLEAGVNLALGADTGATRLDFDPFRELRLLYAALKDRVSAPASTALEIATRGGARAYMSPSGAVEGGQFADLVALDVDAPDGEEYEALARRIVERGGPERVRTVWVGGEVVAADGRVVLAHAPSQAEENEVRARLRGGASGARALSARVKRWLSPAW